ncbi:DUF4365 domain-containing protein [Dyadobacter frigoris]|uniref:DUF4365 domain-containing protein n=1 Tax=Dyadobacter frigoris TaxID=2576211 RepID=A0A4U6DCG1_9BACT|nr:DUF4365 domain-containing protein [Dyadobacter frigoris]TKT94057.1 DUF4365 domain-containing protein [Dyadobacter frigoris]
MKNDTRMQDAMGTSVTRIITQGNAGHGFQDFAASNDNGVDGMIILRKNGVDTGEILFVQIKCGGDSGYFVKAKKRPDEFGVKVGKKYIDEHRPRWNRISAPVILIYVDYNSQKAWWADLKEELSYSSTNKGIIRVKERQRFGQHSFGEFRGLKGRVFISPEIETMSILSNELNYIKVNKPIKECAKQFYKGWINADIKERQNPVLGEIIVSRVGWRHITRTDRKQERLVNSLQLLSVAQKIIMNSKNVYSIRQVNSILNSTDKSRIITDYIALKNNISFPSRQTSLIQVILKRKRKIASDGAIDTKIWFYSVYEPLSQKTN